KEVNSKTWGDISYAWPEGTAPSGKIESHYYIYWMQNMPGFENKIRLGDHTMNNWWEFTADWDRAIRGGLGLYK
ncbi:MAG TPA: hypothetical protein VKM56_07735, partial [Verrucomicrobiae bacterium]|nr:hypothetical protein [Verrucomicrobiae bacterium]